MTEDDAKTKACCGPSHVGAVRDEDRVASRQCIASACMAWRWESEDSYEERFTEWEDAANIGGVQRGPEPEQGGYCGLAGRP